MGGESDAFAEWASQPYAPIPSGEAPVEAEARVARALEYIVAQLGEISRKLDHIGFGYRPTSEDFEALAKQLKKL